MKRITIFTYCYIYYKLAYLNISKNNGNLILLDVVYRLQKILFDEFENDYHMRIRVLQFI